MTGGGFLLRDCSPDKIFIPEEFGEEERAMVETARAFLQREVAPRAELIEAAQNGLMPELMKKAGALGLLMMEVPEEYGGLALGEKLTTWISEVIAETSASLAITLTGHIGIGTLAIVYSGNSSAKQRYLPSLMSGEKIGCFALTEPEYGSDALSAKTTAELTSDGTHYVLNGNKQFTTNAGFGGIFTVFAQVPGKGFTAFVVDGSSPGLSTGREEKKMGLKGTSTRSLIMDHVKVPAENVLGRVGRGQAIALNMLNLGRIKVAACCVGSARTLIRESLSYAQERKQFGRPIASFGLIQQKLGRMAAQMFAAESALYRTSGLVEDALSKLPKGENYDNRALQAIGEYAAECSLVKIQASETLDFVADEAVQIFGGYGYIEDYPVARAYRDARVNRIFEGTNEINRLSAIDWLHRLDRKGKIPLLEKAKEVWKKVNRSAAAIAGEIDASKTVLLSLWALIHERFGDEWQEQQELLAMIADIAIEIYAAESASLRSRKIAEKASEEFTCLAEILARLCRHRLVETTRQVLPRFLPGVAEDEASFRKLLSVLEKQMPLPWTNMIRLERGAAARLLRFGSYPFPVF